MLEKYLNILEGKEKAAYLKSKESGEFEIKLKQAMKEMESCNLCEYKCGINRYNEKGVCNTGKASIAAHFMHYGEESILVPSYTIFFSGCNFRCIYCQNWDISQRHVGLYIEPETMARFIERAYERGAKNVNWVGGEPTPNIPYIMEVLDKLDINIPQIWNSNMYCSIKAMELLDGIIDIYLTDFKYGNNKCAMRLSKVKNYWEIVTRNHEIAYSSGEMIIRHLILPGHVECCSFPVLEWISQNVPEVMVNIMDQYTPYYMAEKVKGMNRRIYEEEYESVLNFAVELGLNIID